MTQHQKEHGTVECVLRYSVVSHALIKTLQSTRTGSCPSRATASLSCAPRVACRVLHCDDLAPCDSPILRHIPFTPIPSPTTRSHPCRVMSRRRFLHRTSRQPQTIRADFRWPLPQTAPTSTSPATDAVQNLGRRLGVDRDEARLA